MDYGILSVIPPILAIVLSFWLKNAVFALLIAIYTGFLFLAGFQPVTAFSEMMGGFIAAFSTKFAVVILVVMALAFGMSKVIEESGASAGFVEYMTKKHQIIKSKKGSQLLTWIIGVILYMNSVMSIVLTTLTTKSLNDGFHVSREKQAMIIKTTGPPMCGLIPIGQWGGVLIGLIAASGIENTSELVLKVIPFNFYCILSVFSMLILILLGKDFFGLKKAEQKAEQSAVSMEVIEAEDEALKEKIGGKVASPAFVFVPSIALLVLTIGYMLYTGNGVLIQGAALDSVLVGVILTSLIVIFMNVLSKNMSMKEVYKKFMSGMGGSMEILVILVLAVTFGGVVSSLGTGQFLADTFSSIITPALLPALVFLIGSLIGYSTGSATGTAACMMPIAIPWAIAYDANLALVIAAAWNTAFFGDHISPISDTTYLTAGIVGCDLYPLQKSLSQYGLVWAGLSFICYLVAGFIF